MIKQTLATSFKVLTLAGVLFFGTSYSYAWNAPKEIPPGGNISGPINIGATAQSKTGDFTATNLTAVSTSTSNVSVVAPKYCIGANCITAWPTGDDNLGNHVAKQALNMNGNSILNAGYTYAGILLAATSITAVHRQIQNFSFYAAPFSGGGINIGGDVYVSKNVRAQDYIIWPTGALPFKLERIDSPGTICGYATNGCGWAGSAKCQGVDPYCGACPVGYTRYHWLTDMGDHHLYFCAKN